MWKFILLAVLALIGIGVAAFDSATTTRENAETVIAAARVADMIDVRSRGVSAAADAVRDFIHRNSIHKIDAEFFAHWGDNKFLLTRLSDHANGVARPPHLECSTRAGLAEIILREMGYRTRGVVVYNSKAPEQSHTLFEVHNPDTGRWELHDADFNAYWANTRTQERVGIREAMASDLATVSPCTEDKCGWHITDSFKRPISQVKPRFDIGSIRDYATGERPLLVSRQRTSDARVEALCNAVPKDCRSQIIVLP